MLHVDRYLLLSTVMLSVATLRRMKVEYHWSSPDFAFPSIAFRRSLLQSGRFIPGAAVPLDVDKTQDGRVFVTVPRLLPGVPATLATLGPGRSPLLHPYPDWTWHNEGDCQAITSVFRVMADRCGRLWVPDTGIVDTLNTFQRLCPPQLLIFYLATNKLIVRQRFPAEVVKESTLPVTIVVDTPAGKRGCRHSTAYIADVSSFALIVYSLAKNRFWRIESNYFYPYPRWGNFNIDGSTFDLMDGVIGLALRPSFSCGAHFLYFHSLASDSESYVRASILRNPDNFPNGTNLTPRSFHVFPGTRPSQSAAEAMDDNGILFFSHLTTNSLHCWNSRFSYIEPNLVEVERDDVAFQFASGIKVIDTFGDDQELWVITCRFQKVMTGTLQPEDINFRILRGSIKKLVKGTSCEILHLRRKGMCKSCTRF